MKQIIIEMIRQAEEQKSKNDFDSYDYTCNNIYNILSELAQTYNCPCEWRQLGQEIAETYHKTRIYEDAKLYDFE